jgi:capsular polysaccharide biosynthesis protein
MDITVLSIPKLFKKYSRFILLFTSLSMLVAVIITFLMPKTYFASAEWTAVNTQYTDKSFLEGNNLQTLVSMYGSGDDNNRLITIAHSEKIFNFLIDSFSLDKIYDIKLKKPLDRYRLIKKVRKDIEISVTERNAISTNVIAKNPELASNMANAICIKTNDFFKGYVNGVYLNNIKALLADSNIDRKLQNQKTIGQYQNAIKANAPAMFILQEATPQVKPYSPKLSINIITAFIASIAFCIIYIAVKESKNI